MPEKMEYVVRTIGRGRVVAAATCGALTRPLGMRGAFYLLAGPLARDVDGGRPPYEDLLFPPLAPADAQSICAELERALVLARELDRTPEVVRRRLHRAGTPPRPDAGSRRDRGHEGLIVGGSRDLRGVRRTVRSFRGGPE